jgi:hypothetical protein
VSFARLFLLYSRSLFNRSSFSLSVSTAFLNLWQFLLSPSRRHEAPCEGTNSTRLFTPGETKALAESKVHQISRAWVTSRGWSSSLISNIWRTVMNSGHWLVQFKICIITTAWRQRNSKTFLDLMIDEFFGRIFARFCKFQKFSHKGRAKESVKRREPTLTKVSLF